MSNAGAVVVTLRLRKEREIVAALRERGALSQKAAATLAPPQGLKRSALRSLIRNGAVKETAGGAYYLDEPAYEAMRSARRVRLGLVLAAVLAALAIATIMTLTKT